MHREREKALVRVYARTTCLRYFCLFLSLSHSLTHTDIDTHSGIDRPRRGCLAAYYIRRVGPDSSSALGSFVRARAFGKINADASARNRQDVSRARIRCYTTLHRETYTPYRRECCTRRERAAYFLAAPDSSISRLKSAVELPRSLSLSARSQRPLRVAV